VMFGLVMLEMLHLQFVSAFQAASEGMRGRLLWVELMMMCIVLVMGLWQIQYLKRYFQVRMIFTQHADFFVT